MASVTVAKTIGSTGVFSTLQLWEDGAPVNLTTSEKSAAGTFSVAAFIQGESLSFVGSGATGKLLDTDSTGAGNGTYVTYGITSGNPTINDVVTGESSGATCVLSSSTPDNVGVIWQGQCQNQEFTGTGRLLTIQGSTTSSTAYKELTTAPGASFVDNTDIQTNALRYNASNGCGIRMTNSISNTIAVYINEPRVRINKLQISADGTDGKALGFDNGGSSNIGEFLIIEGTYTGTSGSMLGFNNASTILKNSIIILRATGSDRIINFITAPSSALYNCTIVAPDDLTTAPTKILLSDGSSTITVQNCSLFAGDGTKAISSGTGFTFITCYSDISGTNGVTQTTYSNEFQNINDTTRDFRLKSGAAQIETGTYDPVNARVDIAGTIRASGSLYDVGCWEFVQTPSASDRPLRSVMTNLRW